MLTALLCAGAVCAGAPVANADQRLLQLSGNGGCIVPGQVSGCAQQAALFRPWGVAVRDNQAYVSDYGTNRILIYDRDPISGALTPRAASAAGCIAEDGAGTGCADAHGLVNPTDMALSPDGTALYVVASSGVVRLTRDTTTGDLTQVNGTSSCVTSTGSSGLCSTAAQLDGAASIAVSANGQNVYTVGQNQGSTGFLAMLDTDGGGVVAHDPADGGCAGGAVANGCIAARAMPATYDVAIPPDGNDVYVTSSSGQPDGDAVTAFSRASDGTLTAIAGEDGCLASTGEGEGCAEDDDLGARLSGIVFGSDTRGWVAGANSGSITTLNRDASTGGLTVGSCVSSAASGPTSDCADLPNDEGYVTDLALTADHSALVAAGRRGRGLTAFSVGSDGSLTPGTPPLGCIATGADLFPTTCTVPRGFTATQHQEFGPPALALSADGRYVYAASPALLDDGAGIVAASRDTADPACAAATVEVASGQNTTLPLSCADPDGDPFTVAIASAPAAGSLGTIDQAAGTVPYTAPETASELTTSLTFKAIGASGRDSVPATVTINVHPPASNPGTGGEPGGGGQPIVTPPPGVTLKTIGAKVKAKWKFVGTVTIVKLMNVTGVPTGSAVTISCKGKGCPFKKKSFKPKAGSVSATKALGKAKLKKGTLLSVQVTHAGLIGKSFSYTVTGKKKAPKAVVKCLPPGGKPAAC